MKFLFQKISLIEYLIAVLLVFSVEITAQERKNSYTVKAGNTIADVIHFEEMYKYPAFTDGEVFHKNGNIIPAKMNYNYLVNEIQFIQNRDTLAIANEDQLDYIKIEEDTFIYDKGYLLRISHTEKLQLFEKEYIKLSNIKQEGAYGTSSSAAATDNITSISSGSPSGGGHMYNLTVQEDRVYSRKIEYFLKKPDNKIVQIRRNILLKSFPDNKKEIQNFIKQQSIDFDNKEDLLHLFDYLNDLDDSK